MNDFETVPVGTIKELEKVKAERDALASHLHRLDDVCRYLSRHCEDKHWRRMHDLLRGGPTAPTASLARLKADLWQTEGCICQGCGERYRDDLIVDDALWERIKPEGKAEGAGLLCGKCIFDRALGILRAEWQAEVLEKLFNKAMETDDLAGVYFVMRQELRRQAEEN